MKVIIIDDEPQGRKMLSSILKKEFADLKIIAEASSAFEARILIMEHQPDLIFLDINMPMLNGFDLLQSFVEKKFHFIIISAYNTYANDALRYGAVDYLLKPIILEELKLAVDRAKKLIQRKAESHINKEPIQNTIILNTQKGTDIINIDDLLYAYAQINYVDLYLTNGTKNNYAKTLKSFEETLPKSIFIRVHKSYIINSKYITGYDKINKSLILNKDIKIPVARDKRSLVNKLLQHKQQIDHQ